MTNASSAQPPHLARLDLLRRVPCFAGLADDLLAALAAVAGERHCARGEVIFLEGDPCAGLFVVVTGGVKIYKLSLQGREQVLRHLGPGSTFNDVAALDGGPNPASAAATADTTLLVFSHADIRRLARAHPALAWAFIESISFHARYLVQMVEDLALRPVKARLARLLLNEAERSIVRSEIGRNQMVTQTEMAARLGTVREMVGRALRELADERLIVMDRHRIVIADRAGLMRVAEGG